MVDTTNGTVQYRIAAVERTLDKANPEVMLEQIRNLRAEVANLKRAFYTLSISIVGAAVTFAFVALSQR